MWDVQPSEFWGMAIRDWWWEYAARQEEVKRVDEFASQKPWQRTPAMREARKRHAEKMRQKNGASSNPSG